MKATFFSVLALAASAFAAPATNQPMARDVVDTVEVRDVTNDAFFEKRTISSGPDVINCFEPAVSDCQTHYTKISNICDKVKAGTITKTEGASQCVTEFTSIKVILTSVVTQLTGVGALNPSSADCTSILNLVVQLCSNLLVSIKLVINVCGLTSALSVILNAVIVLLCQIISLIIVIVVAIKASLISALGSLCVGLNVGVIATVCGPLLSLYASLLI
ncbi:hypothetical protein B0T10DRAFT_607824 [Thelonectria olida]|uniref:Uncharacterized protein n=1 Tax=Thelonectria olida TaxID=1576542 RepID=A0A9P8W3J8_9HYPO|nr:hypothetical protein B0T10DRAFT_607824 [Thelonectria olida]